MSLNDFEITYTPGITAATLRVALDRFQTRHGHLPHAINVHPASVGTAQLALTRLGLDLPIQPNGGALFGEIWQQTNSEETPHA